MTAAPTISVVIPCFNAERYVGATVESVLAQAWPNLQIIIVDDGSSDGSCALVQQRFPEVTLIRQANQGVAAARNAGIRRATGEWIAFVDADDIWLPGKLHRQWEQLRDHPGVRMNYTAWEVWQSQEPTPPSDLISNLQFTAADARWAGASGWIYPELLLDCAVWTSTVMAHRSLFEEVGRFDTSLRIGEDYDLWLRISRVTQILRVSQPLALYRTHPASITKSAPSRNYQGIVIQRALDQWSLQSPDGSTADRAKVYRALATTWSNFAHASLRSGKTGQARESAMTSIRTDWRQLAAWKILVKAVLQSAGIHAGNR